MQELKDVAADIADELRRLSDAENVVTAFAARCMADRLDALAKEQEEVDAETDKALAGYSEKLLTMSSVLSDAEIERLRAACQAAMEVVPSATHLAMIEAIFDEGEPIDDRIRQRAAKAKNAIAKLTAALNPKETP